MNHYIDRIGKKLSEEKEDEENREIKACRMRCVINKLLEISNGHYFDLQKTYNSQYLKSRLLDDSY